MKIEESDPFQTLLLELKAPTHSLCRTFGLSYDGKHTSLGDKERDAKRGLFSKVTDMQIA